MNELNMVLWMENWNKTDLVKQERKAMLFQLFDWQMARMRSLQYDCLGPEEIVLGPKGEGFDPRKVFRLAKKRERVVKIAMRLGKPGLLPFLPVLPRKIVTTYNVMTRLSYVGEKWYPTLNLHKVNPRCKTEIRKENGLQIPYFLFNIDYGLSFAGLSPKEAMAKIIAKGFNGRKKRSFCVNLAEVMWLQIHANILSRAPAYACGSKYREDNLVPGLHIDEQGHPALTYGAIDAPKENWVCPSYQARMLVFSWKGLLNPRAWLNFRKWQKNKRFPE